MWWIVAIIIFVIIIAIIVSSFPEDDGSTTVILKRNNGEYVEAKWIETQGEFIKVQYYTVTHYDPYDGEKYGIWTTTWINKSQVVQWPVKKEFK